MSSDKLHIGFLLTGLDGGGAERTTLNLAAAFIERGHRADLVIPRLAGDYRTAVPDGMRVWRARIPGTTGSSCGRYSGRESKWKR